VGGDAREIKREIFEKGASEESQGRGPAVERRLIQSREMEFHKRGVEGEN